MSSGKGDKNPAKEEKGDNADGKAADKSKGKGKEEKKAVEKKPEAPPKLPIQELRDILTTIEKGVLTKDQTLISRALRRTNGIRRKIAPASVAAVAKELLPESNVILGIVTRWVTPLKAISPTAMEVDEKQASAPTPAPSTVAPMDVDTSAANGTKAAATPAPATAAAAPAATLQPVDVPLTLRAEPVPELELYLLLLVDIMLLDRGLKTEAAEVATDLVERLQSFNRRSMDHIGGKIYFYYSLAFERLGRLAEIRTLLLTAHRTATLRHDEPSKVALTNAILRNFLHFKLYAQADKFVSHTQMPEFRSNSQHARYLYYLGKIHSVQLHYSEAFTQLSQAVRKAPQNGAVGFRQAVHKLMCIVQLLTGDIPERSIFRQPALRRSLRPYFQLTQAVRIGDLTLFASVLDKFRAVFVKDDTYTLIIRLRHNVIKTGLRKINLAYSRISIQDICHKLHFESEEEAEYIIAKAISDGVIEATIDSKERCLFSKENVDIYSSYDPQAALDKRLRFCLDIHNSAVKSMRYPQAAPKPKVPAKEEDWGEEDLAED